MRRATLVDAPAVAKIHVESYEASLGDVVDADVLADARSARLPMWTALLSEPPAGQAVFVVEHDEIIGFVSAGPTREPDAGDGEIYALFVSPSSWGTGVGKALLDRGLEHIASLGFAEARLWVLDANRRARRFYDSAGWTNTGIVRENERGRFLRYAVEEASRQKSVV